jgi:hypothetical protein
MGTLVKNFFLAITLTAVLSAPAMQRNQPKLYNFPEARKIVTDRIEEEFEGDKYVTKALIALLDILYQQESELRRKRPNQVTHKERHSKPEIDDLFALFLESREDEYEERKDSRYGTV